MISKHIAGFPLLISYLRKHVELFFDLGVVEVVNDGLTPHARNGLIFVALAVDVPKIHVFRVVHESSDQLLAAG